VSAGVGPDGAFDEFYRTDYPRLVAAIGLLIGDLDLARDAVDEALARAWERMGRGESIDCLPAWVRSVALNVVRGRFRRRAIERRVRSRIAASALRDSSTPHAGLEGIGVDVRRALTTLPRRQREVTILYYFLDLSVEEIAGGLSVSEGTVKTSLHRARAALAPLLQETRGDEYVSSPDERSAGDAKIGDRPAVS
jgi:RNA polymerase sigma-70 factor (ECF subfamily)